MRPLRIFLAAASVATLCACASSPPARYFTLDDGRPTAGPSPDGPRVVVQIDLPELIDRPQLVVRGDGHQVQFSEQNQWAEPLRSQLARVMARSVDEALDGRRGGASPTDGRREDPDYKVRLSIQKLEAVAGRRVDVEASWRVRPPSGPAFSGRGTVTEPVAAEAGPVDYPALVAAQSRALRRLAASIAADIDRHLGQEPQR